MIKNSALTAISIFIFVLSFFLFFNLIHLDEENFLSCYEINTILIRASFPRKKILFSKLCVRRSSTNGEGLTSSSPAELSPQEIRENVAITRNNLQMAKESLDLSLDDYKQQCDIIAQRALSHEQRLNYISLTNEMDNAIRQVNQVRQVALATRQESVSATGLVETQADLCNTSLKKRFLDQADALIQQSGVSLSRRETQIRQEYHGDLQDLSISHDRAYIEHINSLKELRAVNAFNTFSTNPEPVAQDSSSGNNPTGNGTTNTVPAASGNASSLIDDYADPNLEMQDFNDPDS